MYVLRYVTGILIEGIGGVLSGMWGSGTGTSSFSENVGAIGITKVSSYACRKLHQVTKSSKYSSRLHPLLH
jgi:xanthine/uracil permease